MSDFRTDYIAKRHPNSPAFRYLEAETPRFMENAVRSMSDTMNKLYCLQNGIIQPGDLPADMVAI